MALKTSSHKAGSEDDNDIVMRVEFMHVPGNENIFYQSPTLSSWYRILYMSATTSALSNGTILKISVARSVAVAVSAVSSCHRVFMNCRPPALFQLAVANDTIHLLRITCRLCASSQAYAQAYRT